MTREEVTVIIRRNQGKAIREKTLTRGNFLTSPAMIGWNVRLTVRSFFPSEEKALYDLGPKMSECKDIKIDNFVWHLHSWEIDETRKDPPEMVFLGVEKKTNILIPPDSSII